MFFQRDIVILPSSNRNQFWELWCLA